MDTDDHANLFRPEAWFRTGRGPRYEQLYRYISAAISTGDLQPETQLPPERELAEIAQVDLFVDLGRAHVAIDHHQEDRSSHKQSDNLG